MDTTTYTGLASRLYPDTAESAPPTAAPSTSFSDAERRAARLYPPAPPGLVDPAPNEEIRALRESQPARAIYLDRDQLGNGPHDLAVAINPTSKAGDIEQRATTLASIAVDTGMNRDDVAQLAAFARQYSNAPPTDAEQAAHTRTAVMSLRDKYGPGFQDAMDAARALVRRDPRLGALLDASRLGNHPWAIERFAELGLAARARGELKTSTK